MYLSSDTNKSITGQCINLIVGSSHNKLKNKIIAVIPCHMASIRFPTKFNNLYGLPMVEHVRRRALISKT